MSRLFFLLGMLMLITAGVLQAADITLFDAATVNLETVKPQTAKLTRQGTAILVETEKDGTWPGFFFGKQNWNLESCDRVMIEVTNHDAMQLQLNCRLDSPEIDWKTMGGTITQSFTILPGETQKCRVTLPNVTPPQLADKLFAMRGFPGGSQSQGGSANVVFHRDAVTAFTLFLNNPGRESRWSVGKITAVEGKNNAVAAWRKMTPEAFFPMIDQYGQFKHEDWPGKIHSDAELLANIQSEKDDLTKHPGPKNRSPYGGFTAGPKLEATGHFRVQKHDGRWWFVDPDGYLFWSHGVDCVGTGNGTTPITDREFYFADLPARDADAFKICYGQGWWAPHNYYENKTPYATFNFTQANLIRKYGPDGWYTAHADMVHKRLKSWGMNTIANWSDRDIYKQQKTPYTATMGTNSRFIEGSAGYWGKFVDPFSLEFEAMVSKNADAEGKRSGDDPWCVGYFVDNEISWGNERSLAIGAITSPADQPAKLVFVEDLKKKYGTIEKLNAAWKTTFIDWDAALASTEKPDETHAGTDLDAFHKRICEKYFRTIRDALKKAAPNKLYLGCRFAWGNETAIRASAEFCDVVSFNRYQRALADLTLPEGIDMPVVIGEFHFGALDRGMFHTGLVATDSQQDRADAYETYVLSALAHPAIIGTHWFQYGDQATTGRGDGENYQIGFLTVTDTPYSEIVAAARRVGYKLYEIRMGEVKK